MKERLETYCQSDFLLAFFDSIPRLIQLDGDNEVKSFVNLSQLLYKRCEFCVDDLQALEMAQEQNPYIKKLIKGSTTGGSTLTDFNGHFQNLTNNEVNHDYLDGLNPFSLHLYNNLNHFFAGAYNMGLMSVEPDTLHDSSDVLHWNKSVVVNRKENINEFKNWSILEPFREWVNAAMIMDRYLLSEPSVAYFNLADLLKNILPAELDRDFHLSIVVERDKVWNMEDVINNLTEEINQITESNYEVKLGLFLLRKEKFHDRNIVTNSYRIHSGHSYTYKDLEGNIRLDTTATIHGINGIENNPHFSLIKGIKPDLERCDQGVNLFGFEHNRLLSVA